MGALLFVRRAVAAARALLSPSPQPCQRCLALEEIGRAKDAEIARATARETANAAHVGRLEAQVAALADTRAAAVASRISGDVHPPKERAPRQPTMPAFANQLISSGNVDMERLRARFRRRPGVQLPPPAV